MANTLKSQLTFTDVAPGGTATLPHDIKLNGTDIEPDHITFENQNFDYVSSTATTLTVINNGAGVETGRVLCELWHTIERVFGDGSQNLPNKPFIDRGVNLGGGGGGTGPSNWQSFTYTATGAEGAAFTVAIPVAQPDANYEVLWRLGTVVRQFSLAVVDGSELVGAFDVETTTAPELGDLIHFSVFNP